MTDTGARIEIDDPQSYPITWVGEFCSKWDEWHAVVLGWCKEMNDDEHDAGSLLLINAERWYYEFGRVLGTWTRRGLKIAIGVGLAYLVWKGGTNAEDR